MITNIGDKKFSHFNQLYNQQSNQKKGHKSQLRTIEINEGKGRYRGDPIKRNIQTHFIIIGIHYGKVLAGVIGAHKPQFSLIGDTVNTASRICQFSNSSRITLSEEAYKRLGKTQLFFIDSTVNVKGKGILTIYNLAQNIQNTQYISFDNTSKVSSPQKNDPVKDQKTSPYKKNILSKLKYSNSLNFNEDKPSNIIKQKLCELEIQEEDEFPEENKFIPETKNSLKIFQKFDENSSPINNHINNQNSQEQEFMMKVQGIFLNILNIKNEIFEKFYSDNMIESSQSITIAPQLIQSTNRVIVFTLILHNAQLITTTQSIFVSLMKIIDFLFSLFFVIYQPKNLQLQQFYKISLHVACVYSHINCIILSILFSDYELIRNIIFIEHICALNNIQNFSFVYYSATIPHAMIVIILWVFILIRKERYIDMVKIVILLLFEIYRCYARWVMKIENFNNLIVHDMKKSEKDILIKYLVPQHVLNQFLEKKKQHKGISESLEKVTILFADIAGFTNYSNNKHPSEVVRILRNLFTTFDKLCLKHSVYKLYTMGGSFFHLIIIFHKAKFKIKIIDCYVVLGMIDKFNRNYHEECKNVVEMGFSMIEAIDNIKKENKDFQNVNMRIGMHMGEKILGGIIGTKIIRYDIFGQDMVIANKMESNGYQGKINISEDTKIFLQSHYPKEFKFEKNVEVQLEEDNYDDALIIKSYFIEKSDLTNNLLQSQE